MKPQVAVLLAEGFEDIEAVTVIDVLRRADVPVCVTGVDCASDGLVKSTHDLYLKVDCALEDLDATALEMVVFPGGLPGATNLASSEEARLLARTVNERGGWAAAICAAPIALSAAGLLKGVEYTCYPSFEKKIPEGIYTGARVQVCRRIVTACGPGASIEFAFTLLKALGKEKAVDSLRKGMLVSC
jgi:4-methyl-5(b-hydroxyethyl)-thiazole monophosphate biosynthesis